MKRLTLLLIALLCISPLMAKPKTAVPVYVHIHEGNMDTETNSSDYHDRWVGGSYSREGSYTGVTIFMNVVVSAQTSDNASAVAANDGKWCLRGDSAIPLDPTIQYQGVLQGDGIDISVLEKNGKTKKIHFGVYDRTWKDLSEAMRLYKTQH